MSEADFEKLGVFYLGKEYDLAHKNIKPELCLYDSQDLVTHAVCLGMTGSGKTGLCIGLIEEAAIDGIPVIAIDPKGDISNVLLQFPQLRGLDFQPWVDAEQARRSGMTLADYADRQAQLWKQGLADWGQSGARIQRLQAAADFTIYTPGSSAGIQVSVLKSFAAPPEAVLSDSDLLKERIATAASSILALLSMDADPLRSREHILLANILKNIWQKKQDLTLPALIQLIQKPPITQIGVLDLEAFYPAKERFELSMALNNLLASPGFESWMQGEPLDIDRILYTSAGHPRINVFSIAHLGESERMFFVSMLLNQLVSWMRQQSGTTSLRAIVYMDEIFGYFPPSANPPSKTPLLTLMKQGRAYGLGVLLASQNPVDLDYKGLANAGTWFIGRLQTERDKMRVLDGLEGAATNAGSGFDRQAMDKTMSALGGRVFLMNNVHDDQPVIFTTRWTLSYLRGPVTREQIKKLMSGRQDSETSGVSATEVAGTAGNTPSSPQQLSGAQATVVSSQDRQLSADQVATMRPLVQPGIPEYFLPVRQVVPAGKQIIYKPMLIGIGNIRFLEAKAGIDSTLQYSLLATVGGDGVKTVDWDRGQPAKVWLEDLQAQPEAQANFEPLPPGMGDPKSYQPWGKDFANWLYHAKKLPIWKSGITQDFSRARESERDFRIRLAQSAREQRDKAAVALKTKYAPKLATLQEKLRRAQQVLEREQMQAKEQQMQAAISVGATVLGAFMGRRTISSTTIGRATTAARSMSRTAKEQQDAQQAEETVDTISAQLEDLNRQFSSEMQALDGKFDPAQVPLESVTIMPKKTNITVVLLSLAWAPFMQDIGSKEIPVPAWIGSHANN